MIAQRLKLLWVFIILLSAAAPITAQDTFYVKLCAKAGGDGSIEHPFISLENAIQTVPAGSKIVILPGVYPKISRVIKPLTLTAPYGTAVVGGEPKYSVGKRVVCVHVTKIHPNVNIDMLEHREKSRNPYYNCDGYDNPDERKINVKAIVYYPATENGEMCGGQFPAVVYAHGYRNVQMTQSGGVIITLCDWSRSRMRDMIEDLTGSEPYGAEMMGIHFDYLQAKAILTRLAMSGIIAISVDVSWLANSYPEGRGSIIINTLAYLCDENKLKNGWLEGAIDLTQVGLLGHSQGGGAAIWAAQNINSEPFAGLCLDDIQIQAIGLIAPACPILNQWDCFSETITPPDVPVLVINGTNEISCGTEEDPNFDCQNGDRPIEIYKQAKKSKHLIVVEGANHFGYTDFICLDPVRENDTYSEVGGIIGEDDIDRQKAQELQQLTARNYVHAFFSYYLKGHFGALAYLTGYQSNCDLPVGDFWSWELENHQPLKLFDDLVNKNVVVGVFSCQ